MYQTVNWRLEHDIGFIELNSPPANSMNKLFFVELRDIADRALNNQQVKAIIISGRGRHFSSGADINDLLSFDEENKAQATAYYVANSQTFKKLHTATIPVIAAVSGICLGSAMELAMACHFRIAADNTIMGFPESTFHLMTGCGGSVYTSKFVGKNTLINLMMTGNNLQAAEAEQLGLIDLTVSKNEVVEKAVTFAKKITEDYKQELRLLYVQKYLKSY